MIQSHHCIIVQIMGENLNNNKQANDIYRGIGRDNDAMLMLCFYI